MTTPSEIDAKKAKVEALRAALQNEKSRAVTLSVAASQKFEFDSLSAEEANLQAELEALRSTAGTAPSVPVPEAPAASPKPNSPNDAATK
jgi:hypothetical protein